MPNDQTETLAAILAEMREAGRSDEHADGPLIEDYADRIEAAAKRERAHEIELAKLRSPGNAAALREALLSVARSMEIESRISCTEKGRIGKFGNTLSELCKGCRARNCECWQMTLKREVESALSAPPRNCDLYKDCNAAWKAYNALDKRERLPGFDFWLFEEAKQEGGER